MKYFIQILLFNLIALKAKADEIYIPENTGLPDPDGGLKEVLLNFTSWLLTIFLVLAVLSFVITGIMFLISLGDSRSQSLENAKKGFQYSIIAVITVGVAYILITSIDKLLRGTLGA